MRALRLLIAGTAFALVLSACGAFTTDGSAPKDAEVYFAFGLQRDQSGLAAAVQSLSTPGDATHGQFLALPDIADQYGATEQQADSALSALQEAGFNGAVDPTRGVISGSFSVAEAEAFFGVAFDLQTNSDGSSYITPKTGISGPGAAPFITQVYGGQATYEPDPTSASATASGPPPECPEFSRTGPKVRDILSKLYGLGPLDAKGVTGKGIRAGILEIGYYSAEAERLFDKCSSATVPPIGVTRANVTEQQLPASNSETALDLASLAIVAPGLAHIEIVQFDGQSSLVFPLTTVLAAQTDESTRLDVVSSSVAFCGKDITPNEQLMSEWLMMSLAASGTAFTASAGDAGSSSCYPPNQEQSTQYPSSSAYAVSVGGTMLDDPTARKPKEVVWNESPEQELAGGGGPSQLIEQPWYQEGLEGETARQTPDVAFVADPSDVGPIAVCNRGSACEFQNVAGTSATAPGFAGALALILESYRRKSPEQDLGLLNPAIYQIASGDNYDRSFFDVTQGDNDLFDVGCCTAEVGYDMASGWGSVQISVFANQLRRMLLEK